MTVANINGAIVGFSMITRSALVWTLVLLTDFNNPIIGNHLLGLAVQNIFTFHSMRAILPLIESQSHLHYWKNASARRFYKDIRCGISPLRYQQSRNGMGFERETRILGNPHVQPLWAVRLFR